MSTKAGSDLTLKKKSSSRKKKEKREGEAKDIYFIILYQRKQQEKPNEFDFSETGFIPLNIYKEELLQENGAYLYLKVFKFIEKTNTKYTIEFEIVKDYYIITFEVKENSFVYEVELKQGNKILTNIAKVIIEQNIIDYNKKLDLFLNALKNNNEENKKDILYRDTIDLYEKKKGFGFLIPLYVQIYKNKELCPLLLTKFEEMNNKSKDNEKNMDRNKELELYINNFKEISSQAESLINNNSYDAKQFYGIILCYLNYYDINNFHKLFKKLYEEKWEVLYEILLLYFSHFLNPVLQDCDFFLKFITYSISKEFKIFEKALEYIRDLEIFVVTIEKTKDIIYDKYANSGDSFNPIKLEAELVLTKKEKNKEMKTINDSIKSINDFSKKKKFY